MGDPTHPPFKHYQLPYMFSTPLRSLVSKDVTNLFFAGRLASFSHVVFGSERVQKTYVAAPLAVPQSRAEKLSCRSCATMGQAAGTAAAYAIRHGVDPINLKDSPGAVWSIQQQLLRDDAFVIGLTNQDPRDHARNASVTATSELLGSGNITGAAGNVISGQTRAVVTTPEQIGKCGGVPPTQGLPGSNRWISTSLPAALTLQLKAPAQLAQAELVFDTGMHLELDNVGKGQWGAQRQTVRDYVIEGRDSNGQWTMLCNVTENYQRKRIHRLPCPLEPPSPAPPAPAAIAPGALQANACEGMNTPLQMWTHSATGELTTTDGKSGQKLCLGFDDMLAFGGTGKAVVARPCGGENSTKWDLKEPPHGSSFSKLIVAQIPTPCATPPSARNDRGSSFAPSFGSSAGADPCSTMLGPFCNCTGGAGNARNCSCAGSCGKCSGCDLKTCTICDGPTPPSAPPGPPPNCSCVHAVPCVACHSTGTGGQKYFSGTAVQLSDCSTAGHTLHMQWQQLSVLGGPQNAGMLMSGGLCLEAVPATSDGGILGGGAILPPPPMRRRVNRREEAFAVREAAVALGPLSEVRVTVTATNGIGQARINEIRLYGKDGLAPFPAHAAQ